MASKFVRVTNFVTKQCLQRPSNFIKTLGTRKYGSVPEITQADELLYEEFVTKLQSQPETVVTTLDNGLRVASETTNTATATVGLWVDTGSRYETPETNGVAHFLEHLIFKGTEKRSQTDLELEVENMGAQLNAYTSREQTVFYIKCLANDVSKGIDILSDITQNSKLSEEAIERERSVIMREMEEVERNMQEIVFDYLHACAFQRTPLGMTILGPSENIQRFTRQDIAKYIAEHYEPRRMVLAGAGGIKHDSLVKLAEQHFGHLKNTDKNYRPVNIPKFTGSQSLYNDEDMPVVSLAIAVEGAAWDNPDNIPLMLANTMIGNYDRSMGGGKLVPSRLATAFAERPGCHSFQSFNTCYNDTGLWGLYTVCENSVAWEALELVQDTWVRMTAYISEDEMKRAKNLLSANLMLSLDGTTPICEDIGRQILCYGRRIPQLEMQMRILQASKNEVTRVLHEYIYDREVAVSAVGPVKGLDKAIPDYARLQANMRSVKK